MTTVYVNKRLGLALTDSRVSTEYERSFFGLFNLTSTYEYSVTPQKALYVHDRLFLSSGNVSTINKVLAMLVDNRKPNFDKKESCDCFLVDPNYVVIISISKGTMSKRTIFSKKNFEISMGSGSNHLMKLIKEGLDEAAELTEQYVIEQFRKVTNYDKYTDDNINLYRI